MEESKRQNTSPDDYKYIRVGTTIYKEVVKPLLSKKKETMLIPWKFSTIKQDHWYEWKRIMEDIEKYDGFCTIPAHLNYARSYRGFYNLYDPIIHKQKAGKCPEILDFVKHIFGDQYELGLDYLQLIYTQPTQRLPVLCLVSEQRETGKTTFLNLLKEIYGNNMTFNTNDDFRSNFNSDWVSKLIIAIDEVLLDKKEDSERIKNLSTATTYKSEAKGKDRFEVEYFGKIILCSNNESDFMVIGLHETRYWVLKINPIAEKDPGFMKKLSREIPQFLHFLANRKLSTTRKSRLWFTPEQIYTEALQKVKAQQVNMEEKELYEVIREIMEIKELDSFSFINSNIKALLDRAGIKISRSRVRSILEDKWGLNQYPHASTFTTYQFLAGGILVEQSGKGRYYTITKEELDEINVAMLT
jgi:hypothetical protein